jgi:hypothetical protein
MATAAASAAAAAAPSAATQVSPTAASAPTAAAVVGAVFEVSTDSSGMFAAYANLRAYDPVHTFT